MRAQSASTRRGLSNSIPFPPRGDVSIEAGSNGLMLPRSGQILLDTAASTDGAVRLTSVNDTASLGTGIKFTTITAKTDAELITFGASGGAIMGGSINAAGGSTGHVYIDSATAISLNTARAGTNNNYIKLLAHIK